MSLIIKEEDIKVRKRIPKPTKVFKNKYKVLKEEAAIKAAFLVFNTLEILY